MPADGGTNLSVGRQELASEFEEWLAHHEQTTRLAPPPPDTRRHGKVAGKFAALRDEGYGLDELKLATIGAYGHPWRHEHGHYRCESVLHPLKVHDLIERGRAAERGEVPDTKAARGLRDLAALRRVTGEASAS